MQMLGFCLRSLTLTKSDGTKTCCTGASGCCRVGCPHSRHARGGRGDAACSPWVSLLTVCGSGCFWYWTDKMLPLRRKSSGFEASQIPLPREVLPCSVFSHSRSPCLSRRQHKGQGTATPFSPHFSPAQHFFWANFECSLGFAVCMC